MLGLNQIAKPWFLPTLICAQRIVFGGIICIQSVWYLLFIKIRLWSLGVPFTHLFVYICWSYRMVALMLCYYSIAPSTCKDDIRAGAICHLQRSSLVNWCIGRPTQVSSCCFGGLFCNPPFYFAASWVQYMTLRQLTAFTG